MKTSKLSNIQLELLKIYSFNSDENDLHKIKSILGKFYAQRLTSLVNKSVTEKKLNQQDIDNWFNEKKQ